MGRSGSGCIPDLSQMGSRDAISPPRDVGSTVNAGLFRALEQFPFFYTKRQGRYLKLLR